MSDDWEPHISVYYRRAVNRYIAGQWIATVATGPHPNHPGYQYERATFPPGCGDEAREWAQKEARRQAGRVFAIQLFDEPSS
jgi:hypothetical protein